ncbi:MAG: hypothetical protein FJ104_12585, partial [Deltaproteobacteria bacterium]|nr:hypothetical protein [Deltaproteobacteria bacterium]
MAARKVSRSGDGPRSLGSVQVDLTARLGAVAPHTTTGLASLDAALGGGLRAGHHLVVTGAPGVGKTSLALMLAYIAARARAATLYAAVGLDDTEVVARLAARTVHREFEQVLATYGTIWDGSALQEPELRGPLSGAIASVFKRVGDTLHL